MPPILSGQSSSTSSRRFGWLAAAIVAGCVFWTIGWFLVAAKIEARLPETLAGITGANAKAGCENAEVRGYPFRFGLFCQTLSYASADDGVTAISGAFRSAAQFYRPGHIITEVDGPLAITAPGLDARVDWKVLQTSVQATADGVSRGSLDGRTVSFDIDGAGLTQKLAMQAGRITSHARKNGPDLDIALYGEDLQSNLVAGLAGKALTLEATLPGQAGLLNTPYTAITVPFETRFHRLSIELDETSSLEISGPVQIGADRRISGTLEVTVRNPQRIIELAAAMDPEIAKLINRFAPLIATLNTNPGNDGITLPLSIQDNRVSLGIFPLGQLPGF
ncbi:MAG: DUF2125 domain-containing protein [Hoeflea sp.]|uniref:DUF2125 domain-containing protein n=1 Tax=Hoeflea sp. TaxID=1940281 RepID=UPI001D3BA016|nr:DUF2125 domain-containing protein [Hoeflea sp.]MBU4528642.1 DUF2125 domain-containing protein [Alphaproteobacteria bacterium]MBU4545553.1 DUF2125 domain-containing protein [Alphaproteobacteria bacterium]MBU4552163.1 DUF2125 domain-containing protein [Alphaproteobacteria bacterium]MBV1726245.1 DUF2125 domain-containing protein [Hoeflea sp.]MBV1762328.1 DUF2125 domain-containing protein [Hoeflea sp.]